MASRRSCSTRTRASWRAAARPSRGRPRRALEATRLAAEALRERYLWQLLAPDRNVRPFQDVLLELGRNIGIVWGGWALWKTRYETQGAMALTQARALASQSQAPGASPDTRQRAEKAPEMPCSSRLRAF